MSIAYLVSSLLWAVGGLLVGYSLGRVVTEVHEVNNAVAGHQPLPGRPRRWLSGQTAIGALVLVVVAASTTLYAQQSACQARLNEQFRDAIVARSDAARVEIAAQRKLLLSRLADATDRETAIWEYLAALDGLDAAMMRHPLPTLTGCGGTSP